MLRSFGRYAMRWAIIYFLERLYPLLSKQIAFFNEINVTMSISKNDDGKLFFIDFSGDSDVTRPNTSLSKHKILRRLG